MKKKIATILITGFLMTAMQAATVFGAVVEQNLPVCPDSGCTLTEDHQHDGVAYCAHSGNDGHSYHNGCGVSGCTRTGHHTSHNVSHASRGHRGHHSGSHH